MDSLGRYLMGYQKPARQEETMTAPKAHYRCQECQDTGWIIYQEGRHEVMKRCSCYAVKRAEELMAKSGLSREFLKKSFDSFETMGNPVLADAKDKAIKYVENFRETEHCRRNSFMFCGQPGSGKTHLGTAICSRLLDMGVQVIYMPYRNAVTRLKQNITDEAWYNREMGMYMGAEVLYIDDIFKGRLTESDVNIMYEIVNYRYMENLPLVISTEKDLEGLLVFDEATGSRIIEMCRDNIVRFRGKELNYRLG